MEEYLVEHCSPTLASLKTGNLFSYSCSSPEEVDAYLSFWNQCMNSKGVFLCALRVRECSALIYVYRKEHLRRDMERPGVKCFLKSLGYANIDVDYAVDRLRERLGESGEFPHEIGLFLGYPLGDVVGFVENSGRNCICSGCWKVYCNESEARRTFRKFKKCTEIYRRLWSQGKKSVLQLTVAA